MKHFKHMQASSAKEAASATEKGTAVVMAGGTDLLGTLKDEILPTYPETVVDLKAAAGMDGISEDGDVVVIGALAKLAAVAESDAVREGCAALAEACARADEDVPENLDYRVWNVAYADGTSVRYDSVLGEALLD